jgi:hypothetical protein
MKRLFPFLVLLGACADGAMLPDPRSCTEATECGDGLTCSFNHCVVDAPNTLDLKVRVTPPPPSGLLPQQLPSLSLAQGPDLLVKLIGPTLLRGGVRFESDTFSVNVPGSIELRTDGDIDGLDFSFTAASLSGVDRDGFGYSVHVLPGRQYVGTFRPEDPTLPRHVFVVSPEDVATGRFDVMLPARSAYQTVKGRVMRSDYVPIDNARVVVLTTAREVIGVASSEEVRGLFEVLVPPSVTEVLIKVESTSASKVFPEFVAGPFVLASDRAEPQLLDLIVPDLPAGTDPVTAVLKVYEQKVDTNFVDVGVEPAAGRAVTIVGIFDGGALRRTGTTDHNGEVTFSLLPGAYECLVSSPPHAAAASWHGHVNLGENDPYDAKARTTEITLGARPPLIGQVLDTFGNPVESGRLTFERRATWREGMSLVAAPAPFEVELGQDGLYATRVDPGVYDVTIAPDVSTGAPHSFETEVWVTEDGLRFDLSLPPPGLLHLTVASPEGSWLPGVRVELWADDDMGEPRLFALGTTGERGYVDMLVPHTRATSD